MCLEKARSCAAAVAAGALLLGAMKVRAANWEWAPRLQVGYEFNDNYRLAFPGDEIEVSGGMVDVQLQMRAAGPLTRLSLTPRLRSTYYPDQPAEESDDYFLGFNLDHTGRKLRAGLRADYQNETVVRSELPDPDIEDDLGETGGADAGRIVVRNERDLIRVNPSLSYAFSPRRSLELTADYLDVSFDRDVTGAQVGYTEIGGSAGFAVASSERSTVALRGLYSSYDPEFGTNDTQGYGLQAEWSSAVSEASSVYVRAGAQRTEIDRPMMTGTASYAATSYVAGAGGRRAMKLTTLFIDATRSVGPTSSGFVVERDQLRFRLTRLFRPRVGAFVGVRGIRDRPIEKDAAYGTRRYATGDVGLEWRMLRQLSLVASYDYTWQEFADEPSDATSEAASLSLIYEPRRRQ